MSRLGRRARSAAASALILLLLGGIIVAFFNRLASGDLILARGDTFLYFYPYWRAAADALAEGRIPLWNPNLFMGAPFLANSQVGFFYPLNWPVWLGLATPYAVSLSIIMHLLIAAWGAYLMARRCLILSRPAAVLAGVLFSLGGYLTAQVEHINQLQGLAWIPWYFVVLCTWPSRQGNRRDSIKVGVGFAAILSLQFLSGHTQTVFISLVAVAVWLTLTLLFSPQVVAEELTRTQAIAARARRAKTAVAPIVLGVLLAICMTAVQLFPTLELTGQSIRRGGLPLNEVLSFSLQPLLLGQSLLPSYDSPIFSEYIASVPVSALLLALIGARRLWQTKRVRPFLILGLLGLALALGRFNPLYHLLAHIPGFNLFRAPARWSVLYALVVALSAAAGWQWLHDASRHQNRDGRAGKDARMLIVGAVLVLLLVSWSVLSRPLASFVPVAPETVVEGPSGLAVTAWVAELVLAVSIIRMIARRRIPEVVPLAFLAGMIVILFFSTRSLSYNHPTTARAYFGQRAPVSRLLAASDCRSPASACQVQTERVLGLSDIFFDLGDQQELNSVYGDSLGETELFDYVVATKQKEILGPNLPQVFGLSSVDGFDGGVLPLESYVLLTDLILSEGEQAFDGRLREHLDSIPEERWLDHFGVKYIITDKVGDQWRQGIFFDMKHPISLTSESNAIRVGYLPEFEATDIYFIGEGSPGTFLLETQDHARSSLSPERVEDDLWRVRLPQPQALVGLSLNPCHVSTQSGQCTDGWHVRSLALVDARDGSFVPLVAGDYRLIYSGDVKIYENLDVSPLASLLFDWQFVSNVETGLARMKMDSFQPENRAVIAGAGPSAPGSGQGQVFIESHTPEKIMLSTESDAPALLLVREAFYPGWQASIDGEAVAIVRADVLFRGIFVPPGTHTVELEYRPESYEIGLAFTIVGLTLWSVMIVYAFLVPVVKQSGRTRLASNSTSD